MQKIVRRESLGAVHTHTHTHTHTSNLKKEEKRVGENSALKVMEKDRQKKGENFLTACLFCVLYTEKKRKSKEVLLERYEKEGVENV